MRIIGILLIVFGIAALAVGGFSYTDRDKVLDLGPIEATTETTKRVPFSPIVGVASIVGGAVLVFAGARART